MRPAVLDEVEVDDNLDGANHLLACGSLGLGLCLEPGRSFLGAPGSFEDPEAWAEQAGGMLGVLIGAGEEPLGAEGCVVSGESVIALHQ